jgi:hypothetical protein
VFIAACRAAKPAKLAVDMLEHTQSTGELAPIRAVRDPSRERLPEAPSRPPEGLIGCWTIGLALIAAVVLSWYSSRV